MREHYIEYEVATGAIVTRGSVDAGTLAATAPQPGNAFLVVPYEAMIPGSMDVRLDLVQPLLTAQVDAEAGATRRPFLTTVEGQDLTYLYKADEARAYRADPTAPTPFITREATLVGITVDTVVGQVLGALDLWTVIGSEIEARRRAANVRIGAATTTAAALVAARVDWSNLIPAGAEA